MTKHCDTIHQANLLELIERPPVALPAEETKALARLLEVLLREIAEALASQEVGNDQDHR
jgi:hypothetical protein